MNKAVFDLFKHLEKEKNNHYVFPSPKTSKKLTNVKKSFSTALKAAGIENFRFHDLRHTSASWMVMEGVSLDVIRELAGHLDRRTTNQYATIDRMEARKYLSLLPKINITDTEHAEVI